MKLLSASRFAVRACACVALAASGCAGPRSAPVAQRTAAPARCGPNRVATGWLEVRSTIAPASFCVPPEMRLVPGRQLYAPPLNRLPYPRARSRFEAWEEWKTPDGRPIVQTSLHSGPDEPRGWTRGAAEMRDTTIAAGCSGGVAVLRQYRVPAAWTQPDPGSDDTRVDTYNAYLELPLGPMRRFTLEIVARDTLERATLIPVLQSVCKLE